MKNLLISMSNPSLLLQWLQYLLSHSERLIPGDRPPLISLHLQ
ncbi:hypothetical protein [Desmonostoc muscorum]|nr:hypothetical protein [Desmonostoc muscorum]